MKKYFNIAGPCNPDKHYMIPSASRCKGITELIEQEQYFVIYAARQSGKTTLLLELVDQLNSDGKYHALYCSLESAQGIIDPQEGIPAIVRTLRGNIQFSEHLSKFHFAENADFQDFNNVLKLSLIMFCKNSDRPLVLLFDETDCLSNGTLISFLRQLRDGYVNRFTIPFVHSVGLIGMRNIRDYRGKIREAQETLGSASPFNIVAEALTLRDFTENEIAQLYEQHTEQTGQAFSSQVIQDTYYYTQGQPWLVNAIAREIVVKILKSDHTKKTLPDHVEKAVETIIHRRDTHIDSLLERLKEERVQRIVEPVITGEEKDFNFTDDDYRYVLELGLLKHVNNVLMPSNPVYSEIMIQKLIFSPHESMRLSGFPPHAPAYLIAGELDMKKLLTDFQHFWRENSAIWEERFQYKEAAPHLILMAFLQRIVNAGGRINRELATGRGRIDLCICYQNKKYPIEIKIRRDAKTQEQGKQQLADYMDTLNCDTGWLVIFDRRKKTSWKNKIFWKTAKINDKNIHIAGC